MIYIPLYFSKVSIKEMSADEPIKMSRGLGARSVRSPETQHFFSYACNMYTSNFEVIIEIKCYVNSYTMFNFIDPAMVALQYWHGIPVGIPTGISCQYCSATTGNDVGVDTI